MNADRRDEESNGGWQFDSSEPQPRPRLRTAAEVADERVREIESGVKQLRPKLTLTPQHLLALGLVLLAILWPSYSIYRWHHPKPKPPARHEKISRELGPTDAVANCRAAVRARLAAPSTAKFRGWLDTPERVAPVGLDRYRVESWVDAQNVFGAMVRNQFTCETSLSDGSTEVTFIP